MKRTTFCALLCAFMSLSIFAVKAEDKAIKFTNNTDEVSLPSFDPTAVCTIEAWIKTSQTSTGTIINFRNTNNGLGFFIRIASGKLESCQWDGSWANPSSTVTVNTGEWTHIAVVRNGSSVKLFVNGRLSGSYPSVMQSDVPGEINNLIIGKMYEATNESYNGLIDEMRIWNTARTDQEIKETYKSELIGTESGLVAYWKFDNEVKNIVDNSIGTVTGATFVTDPIVYTLKPSLQSAISAAQTTNESRPVGDRTGNVNEAAKEAFSTAIASAQSIYDNASSTEDDYSAQITALSTATTEFNAAALPEYSFNISILAEQGVYAITTVTDGKYLKNSRTEADGESETNRPSTQTSETLSKPECYWSFIPSTTLEGKVSIRSRHIEEGGWDFIDQIGRTCASSTFADNIWANFTMVQDQEVYQSTATHIGFKNVQSNNYLIVREDGTIGSSATPAYGFKITLITAVGSKSEQTTPIRVWVRDQKIMTSGTDAPICVYNQQGVQVDPKQKLSNGLYIVRTGNHVQKVIIQ